MTRYLLHATTLGLAGFLLLNVVATAAVAIASRRLTTRPCPAAPALWLALRLGPAVLSIGLVVGVFFPSYWRYEPPELVEGFDLTLTTIAGLGLGVITAAAFRGLSARWSVKRRMKDWLRGARPLPLIDSAVPAFVIETDAPVMALVGVLRPRLLISRRVLNALTVEELEAGVAHELAHQRAWDNLKRLAMRAAPDVLPATSVARALERRWAAASEQAADRAAGESRRARCALASALVKVARLTAPHVATWEPMSALVDGGDITSRVQRLLEDDPAPVRRGTGPWLGLVLAAPALALAYPPLLRVVHGVTEILVNRLP